jgi:hypothetical protein
MVEKCILIDYNVIYKNKLNELINKLSNIEKFDLNSSFETSEILIGICIIIPEDIFERLQKLEKGIIRLNFINSKKFINSIKYINFILYEKNKNICEILNTNNLNYNYLSLILNSVLENFPNDSNIYVYLDNSKQIELFLKFNFCNTEINDISAIGRKLNEYQICLSKKNSIFEEDINECTINDILNVIQIFLGMNKNENENENCKLVIKFDNKTINYIKQIANIGSTTDKNGISQKEISGSFLLEKNNEDREDNEKLVYTMKLITNKFLVGEEEGVGITNSRYNFHSHPREAYDRHQVMYGWPSSQDYIGFLTAIIIYNSVLHVVICLEGVYIISLDKNKWKKIPTKDDLENIKEEIYDTHNIKCKSKIISENKDNKIVDNIEEYINIINKLKCFQIQFLEWKNIMNSFSIYYPKEKGKCKFQIK